MARIAQRRDPAVPNTADQNARRSAILAAAVKFGRSRALENITAQEIAAEAGVALRTLYRYYPSKYHVFAAVLTRQVGLLPVPSGRPADPAEAVAELMAQACRNMLRHKHLAHAMITSTQAVRAQTGATGDRTVRDLILATAGLDRPSADQVRLARLVEQVSFGVLAWTVGGELEPGDAVADVRMACLRLVGDAFNSPAGTPARARTVDTRRRG